jgi:PPOX class probable F420-dependent enzyme
MTIEIPSHVSERLATETIIWLTTSKADGMPLPNPVWFLWQGGEFLVLTIPGSVKLKNMSRNPLLALHLNSNSVDGSDVAVFHVQADVNCAPVSKAELDIYEAKYANEMATLGFTREMLETGYKMVRMKLIKFRTVVY